MLFIVNQLAFDKIGKLVLSVLPKKSMFNHLSRLLIISCLHGQVANVFGLPLAFTPNQESLLSLQFKGCCVLGAKSSCCADNCLCCSSNDLPNGDLQLVQENSTGHGVQVLWLNPVSSNKCKATNLISQFGIEMALEKIDSIRLILSSDSHHLFLVSSLSCGETLSKFKPPRI